jgi:SAM-dependent methyltransferase
MQNSLLRKLFFPSINFIAHKRMKFTKYFQKGQIKTLDVACGGGSFSIVAAKNGNIVIGVDRDFHNIELSNHNLALFGISKDKSSFRQFDIKELAHIGEIFDQVFCFEILEHIIDDESIIRSISKITRLNSVLLISVPNLHHKAMYKEDVSPIENGEHVRFGYSYEQLESMLKKYGFVIKQKDSAGGALTQWATSFEGFLADKLFDGKMPRVVSAGLFITYLDTFFDVEDACIFLLAEKQT